MATSSNDGTQRLRAAPAGLRAEQVRGSKGGVGRPTSPDAEAVSDDLRRGAGDFLRRRRQLAALTLGAMGSLGAVAAYQFGLLRRLPEPPLPFVDAERVDASGEAYQLLKTPDAALGLASEAVTLALIGMGTGRRAEERSWVPLAMAAKVGLDALSGLYLTLEQVTKHRRLCSWCALTAAASLASVPLVLPEAREAARRATGRG